MMWKPLKCAVTSSRCAATVSEDNAALTRRKPAQIDTFGHGGIVMINDGTILFLYIQHDF